MRLFIAVMMMFSPGVVLAQSTWDQQADLNNMVTEAADSSATSLNAIAKDNSVQPCPKFLDSLGHAEQILQGKSRNYPHML